MPRFDWNGNGKRDLFDDYMDMKVMEEVNKKNDIDDYDDDYDTLPSFGEVSSNYEYNTRIENRNSVSETNSGNYRDSNLMVIFKCLLVLGMCVGAMALYLSGSWFGGLLLIPTVILGYKILS